MTKEEFVRLINRADEVGMHAIGRALVHLLKRQTSDEQAVKVSKYQNNRGFSAPDARKGTLTAKFYLKHGYLMDWQIKLWLETQGNKTQRLGKYYNQILEEART